MSWVKVKNLVNGQILTVPHNAGIDICKDNSLFVKIEEPKPEVKQKTTKPKEEKKDVEIVQLNDKDEDNSSGKDKEKVGV